MGARGFAGGGPKKPAIDSKLTDFDVVLVGKQQSTDAKKAFFLTHYCSRRSQCFMSSQVPAG